MFLVSFMLCPLVELRDIRLPEAPEPATAPDFGSLCRKSNTNTGDFIEWKVSMRSELYYSWNLIRFNQYVSGVSLGKIEILELTFQRVLVHLTTHALYFNSLTAATHPFTHYACKYYEHTYRFSSIFKVKLAAFLVSHVAMTHYGPWNL